MMRLFFAIELSRDTQNRLVQMMQAFRLHADQGRWTPAGNLHLTLVFLGNCDVDQIPVLRGVLAAVAKDIEPFTICLDGLGTFGRKKDILWVGVHQNPVLTRIVCELKERLKHEGFSIDERPYQPHITIARDIRLPETFQSGAEEKRVTTVPVSHLTLMESTRVNGQVRYQACLRQDL